MDSGLISRPRYYISFITQLDPNALGDAAPLIDWPQWSNNPAQLLGIGALENGLTPDTFPSGAYDVLSANIQNFRV